MAMTASAFGMSLAVSVVPSSGSSAMSTAGPVAGADLLADVEHRRLVALALADHDDAVDVEQVRAASRMASTAAWSAAFSSPRPISLAAARAAASDTRARPRDSMRSAKMVIGPSAIVATALPSRV